MSVKITVLYERLSRDDEMQGDSITDNRARLSGRRKKFNGNMIEI